MFRYPLTSFVVGLVIASGCRSTTNKGSNTLGDTSNPSKSTSNRTSNAAGPLNSTTTYFSGDANITNLMSGSLTTDNLIMVRTVDPASSMISEIACEKKSDGTVVSSPVYMQFIDQNGDFKVSDAKNSGPAIHLQGSGLAHGDAWAWNYLTFSLTYDSIKIQDVNFLVGNQLIGRKQLFLANGTPLELYEINMKATDRASYQLAFSSMGCPSI